MRAWREPCASCKWRAEQWAPYNCDFVWFTGKSRSSQVSSPEQLKEENCPFYEQGPRAVKGIQKDWLFKEDRKNETY